MSDPHEQQITFLAPESADLAPFFPGYEFEGLIATGGMGAVYCAVQKSLERTVAIKILPQEFSQDAAFCAGFEAEAKAMARLNHPNLIGVYDFGEVNHMLYIIMEYVPGQSLFHSAHGQAIDPGEVVRLVSRICDGLAHAHANGIVHRDIKPSNILLDLNAQPKIGDFGLARPVERKAEEGEDIFGTPHYTAPEVYTSPASVDYRADIFSIGVLLHELLTGRLPADDPRPASVIIHCDPRFDTIIRRATDPLPERRYSNAGEISKDLRAIKTSAGPRALRSVPKAPPQRASSGRAKPVVYDKPSSSLPGLFMLLVAIIIAIIAYQHYDRMRKIEIFRISQPAPQIPKGDEKLPEPVKPTPVKPTPVDPTPVDPTPEPGTDTAPELPGDATGFVIPQEPKYDVTGFFTRARKAIKVRAAPLVTTYNTSIKDNVWFFEKEILRGAEKFLTKVQIKQAAESFQGNQGRVPDDLQALLADVPGAMELHSKSLEKQKTLDSAFQQALTRHAPTYIQWLEKQIEQLKADNDPGAIKLIEDEIQNTRDDAQYFPSLILGTETPKEKPSDEYEYPKDP